MPPFRPIGSYQTLLTHVGVGMGAASFWRGAWYVLDDHLFPNDLEYSAAASLALGTIGMAASQGLVERAEALTKATKHGLALARFGAIYTVATSCVLVWRGTWVGWDCLYERFHAKPATENSTHSGLQSHIVSLTLLLTSGLFASVLAPPAAVSVIRDFTVHSSKPRYQGPAQVMVDRLMGRSSTSSLRATSSAARRLASRRLITRKARR